MPQLCLYFQLHQPYRLQNFNIFDLGQNQSYFADLELADQDSNRQIFQKVAHKSYLPMLSLLVELIQSQPQFKLALSCSGVFLEQAQNYLPKVIRLLKKLSASGQVEFLAETYYHSLAFLYSEKEFKRQIRKHQETIKDIFGVEPQVFRNTELIYHNYIGHLAEEMGFKGVLTEAVERFLKGRGKTKVYASKTDRPISLLLKHALLSDDVAFRFSDKNWAWHPLTAERYLDWVEIYPENEIINLFMDFETFGEHQWVDTGIFDFFKEFVKQFINHSWNQFVTPSQVFDRHAPKNSLSKCNNRLSNTSKDIKLDQKVRKYDNLESYDVNQYISWADIDRDLTAWKGNPLQDDALRAVYALEEPVLNSGNKSLIEDWRRLQTSDHFYYMCTKWSADGDVHAYFSPYQSPLEAYRRYSIVLADLQERLL